MAAVIQLPEIAELRIGEVIGRGARHTAYRAVHDGTACLLRVFDEGDEAWQRGLRRRAARWARARHPSLPAVVCVGQMGASTYVVSELVEGPTLAALEGPLAEAQLVRIGRDLAGGLAALHQAGLVHGGVTPDKVVLGESGQARFAIVDLDPASEGLHLDSRADLYALGALLFDCAAGRAVEGGLEALLDYAQTAMRELNPDVSPMLSAIVTRLLADDPSQRYQSALEVLGDLGLVPLPDGDTLPGGAAGGQPTPLAGRRAELAKLRLAWQEALRERGQIVTLRGPLGSGKSHLARCFLAEVEAGGRLALYGACEAEGGAPYGALRLAFESWLAGFSRLPAPRRLLAERRLRIAAGDIAGLLRLFSPAFERVFEDVPPASETDLMHERFYDIMAEFLLKLAGCYGGLALAIDDMHWLDTSSRHVLDLVAARLEGAPLLLLGAFRTDLQARRQERAPTPVDPGQRVDVSLPPLTEAATGALIAAQLNADSMPRDVTRHVADWTGGSPLAIREYVAALLDAGVLHPHWDGWLLESDGLDSLELPRDVGQLLSGRIERLSPTVRDVLSLASLLDGPLRLGLLTVITGSEAGVRQALAEAVEANILRPAGPDAYEFSHTSVRQALTADLPTDKIRDLHQRIGDALARLPSDDGPRIFATARHCWLGHAEHHWQQVHATNLAAGLAAMRGFADAEALEFLKRAAAAAESSGAPPDPRLDAALGEICTRSGAWDDALTYLPRAIEGASDTLVRAGLRARLARVYVANRETDRAWAEIDASFREIGTPIGRGPLARALYSACCWLLGLLALRFRLGYGMAPEVFRPRLRLLSQLYVTGAYVAYLMNDHLRVLEMVVRQLHTGHVLGDSVEMASALTSYANVLAMIGRRETAGAYSERSIAMVTKLGDRFQLARMRLFDAFQRHVGGQPRRGELAMRRCLQLDGTWLDGADFAYAHIDLAWNLMLRGYVADALNGLDEASAKAQANSGARLNVEIKAVAALAALGRHAEAEERLARIPVPEAGSDWLAHNYRSFLILCRMEQGKLGPELDEAIEAYRACGPTRARGTSFHGRHFFVFQAYARMEQCVAEPSEANLRRLSAALSELRRLRRHPTLGSHYLAISGAYERLRGRPERALAVLLQAESLALRADNPWALFHIHRQTAHTLAAMENHEAALRQAFYAHRLATGQGWQYRAQLIRSEFDSLRPNVEPGAERRLLRVEAERHPERLEQHLEALLQVSLAASTTLDPARQAQVALDELLRVLQAQRAFLFTVTPYGDLQLRGGRSLEGEDLPELTGYSRDVVETVRATSEPVTVSGVEAGQREDAADPRNIVAAPLLMKGDLLGVVYVDSPPALGAFTEDDVRILTAIANHIAIALQNATAVAQQTALSRANADLLEALRQRVSELQDSRRQITAAEERLRREIAEILHSRVQSKLLVAEHQMGQAAALLDQDPAEARRLLELSQEQLDDVREREIRDASHLLHPSIIRIGLAPAVRSLLSRFEGVFEVALEVDPRLAKLDSIVDNQLSEELRLTAYRAVEEAMSNAARHAKASRLDVALALTETRELSVTVRDDGVGFDGSQLQPGLGLSSIAGRVNQLGGAWRLTGEPGKGACVEVVLPLIESSSPSAEGEAR